MACEIDFRSARVSSVSVSRKVGDSVTGRLSILQCFVFTVALMSTGFAQSLEFERGSDEVAASDLALTSAGLGSSESAKLAAVTTAGMHDIGRTSATGLVRQVYVRVGQGVLISRESTLESPRRKGELYADVCFPERLANGAESMLAYIGSDLDVRPGDIAVVRFAHRAEAAIGAASPFPVREVTRVTEIVARNDTSIVRSHCNRNRGEPAQLDSFREPLNKGAAPPRNSPISEGTLNFQASK